MAAATATTAASRNLSLTALRTRMKSPLSSSTSSSSSSNPNNPVSLFAGSFRWFSSLIDALDQLSPSPLLMFPPPTPADPKKTGSIARDTSFCRFYSPVDDKLVKLGWMSPEEFFDARCIGSCNTVLAYISRRDCSIFLFNPFNQNTLWLPPIKTLPCVAKKSHNWFCTTFFSVKKYGPKGFNTDYIDSVTLSEFFIEKLIVSSHAPNAKFTAKDHTVFIIYGENRDIAFWRYGHDSWTPLHSPFSGYSEFVHWKDQIFFALIESSDIVECWDLCCNISAAPMRIDLINAYVSPSSDSSDGVLKKQCKYKRYLVNSNGEILMVVRYFYQLNTKASTILNGDKGNKGKDKANGAGVYMTFLFDVYKLDFAENTWGSVKNIGDNAIFLGTNHSFLCSTSKYDGLKKNSIYFTNDVVYEYTDSKTKMMRKKLSDDTHDFGVFDLEDGSIKSCYYPSNFQKVHPPPVWIVLTESAKNQ